MCIRDSSKLIDPVRLPLAKFLHIRVAQFVVLAQCSGEMCIRDRLNAGQTCVEPDYLLIHKDVKEQFVKAYQNALETFFPDGDYSNMPVLISEKHYRRVKGLLEGQKILLGGETDDTRRLIAPTLLDETDPDLSLIHI